LQRYVNIGNEIMEYLESNYKDNFKNIAVSLALLTLFSVSLYMSLSKKTPKFIIILWYPP